MDSGDLLTRGTIWLALVLYAVGEAGRLRMRADPALERWARWAWTLGGLAYLLHVAAAFHYVHGWSHALAYADTARQTEGLLGLNWGGGIYFNYIFTAIWLADIAWWWLAHESFWRRPLVVERSLQLFFLFMVFNAAVVFPTGPVRWLGLAIVIGLLVVWLRGQSGGPGVGGQGGRWQKRRERWQSAILRTAVEWGHFSENPARGVRLPKLRTVRPKWVLTTGQAASLLEGLSPLPRAMVGLALLSGLRRGELFALRWRDLDEQARLLTVREAVYEGRFGTPKTEAGLRQIPFSAATLQVVAEWRRYVKKAEPEALVFSTRFGKPISPNNILRRWVFPACAALNLPNATWLTFRRTYSTWAHDKGVPAKVVAQLLGHAKVDTTLNVYTQVLDDSLRTAVEAVGTELFRIVQKPETASELIH